MRKSTTIIFIVMLCLGVSISIPSFMRIGTPLSIGPQEYMIIRQGAELLSRTHIAPQKGDLKHSLILHQDSQEYIYNNSTYTPAPYEDFTNEYEAAYRNYRMSKTSV